MQLLSFNEFMAKNEDWLHNDEKIGQFAYKNYCDTTTRYKEEIVTLQDLIQELEKARNNSVHVAYVMGVDYSNFSYVGNDLDLNTSKYIEATECLNISTVSGNDITIPETYDIERHEGIEAFTNTIEYLVREENFTIGFLFYYE